MVFNIYIYFNLLTKNVVCTLCIMYKGYFAESQSCPTLCNSMHCSPPNFSVHGIFQARILEWVAMPSSKGSSRTRDWIRVSCVSCTGRLILYHFATWEAHFLSLVTTLKGKLQQRTDEENTVSWNVDIDSIPNFKSRPEWIKPGLVFPLSFLDFLHTSYLCYYFCALLLWGSEPAWGNVNS